ncbi:hypothetical protein NM208_g6121 [Fusarium decemcellulare]|uniref:Uncharacterized protein n=1 Tax=Fusarium decemcellulare TaxID=57161 RepID=A0ACC1SEF8_9HYPO|nr:hypothetical protein NM208_g6121 [Fusarium decemcellulare]
MVASAIVTVSAPALLNKFAIGLAGEAGTWVFKQILNTASGGSDTEKIRQDISGAVKEIRELKHAVDNLSQRLSDALLQLRSDSLKESLTKIETMYDTIADLIETAISLPEDLSKEERNKKVWAIQARIEDRLKAYSNEIPGILDRINDFLTEDGKNAFLRQAAQQAFDSSTDFIGYYGKTKTLILSYWVVVVKGICLLQMAYDAPNVDFYEGKLTIQRQKDKLEKQERVFRSIVGENTIKLAESLLVGRRVLVSFLSDEGFRIGRPSTMMQFALSGIAMRRLVVDRSSQTAEYQSTEWWVMLDYRTQEDVDVNSSHAIKFRECRSSEYLSRDESRVSTVKDDESRTTGSILWYVKPVSIGSDRYTIRGAAHNFSMFLQQAFQLMSGAHTHYRPRDVRPRPPGKYLAARNWLECEDNVSLGDASFRFQIRL